LEVWILVKLPPPELQPSQTSPTPPPNSPSAPPKSLSLSESNHYCYLIIITSMELGIPCIAYLEVIQLSSKFVGFTELEDLLSCLQKLAIWP
jgi:hypothetical protein